MTSLAEILAAKKAASESSLALATKALMPLPSSSLKEPLAQRLARLRSAPPTNPLCDDPTEALPAEVASEPEETISSYEGAFSLSIALNERQLLAKEFTFAGKSFVLTGAAGTGKTTAQRAVAEALLAQGHLRTSTFKLQGSGQRVQAPSIAFCAYTRRASANLQRAVHMVPALEEALRFNIMTIHALLEYEPEFYVDPEEPDKTKFRFIPRRNARNPLDITHLIIEEASMIGLDLWDKLYEALPLGVQIIFIGDINQLPPVFGPSIMNYALVQLPVIELTHVYRQAGDSLILENAHRILKGDSLMEGPDFQIIRGKQKMHVPQEKQAHALGLMFQKLTEVGDYDPEQDIILSPWNKQELGTDYLNRWVSQFLGQKRKATVYEVQAGFAKVYLAVGDKVMYNKQDGVITKIAINAEYFGTPPQLAGQDLTRFGHRIIGHAGNGIDLDEEADGPVTLNYENFNLEEQEIERKQQASHAVHISFADGGEEVLSTAAAFAPSCFSLGYVLTVHKAQGCEWRKVFIILHKAHAVSLYRELLYTAVTRARENVILIAKDETIMKAIKTQRIKGNSLEDKIEFFNSGLIDPLNAIRCTK